MLAKSTKLLLFKKASFWHVFISCGSTILFLQKNFLVLAGEKFDDCKKLINRALKIQE